MKSVFVSIPVLLVGGTEAQTLNLVRVLVAAGYQTTVCCYYEHDAAMVCEFKSTGAKIILLELDRADGLWHLTKKLYALFKWAHPDIVHIQYVAPGFVPIIAAKLARIPTVFATVHQPGQVYGWKAHFLLRLGASLCTAFFCVSRSTEKSWFGSSEIFDPADIHHGRRHFTVYNGVDSICIDTLAQSNQETLRLSSGISSGRVVGVVGRLREEKGQGTLLEAMARLADAAPDALLLVVGDGPDRSELANQAENLGIGHRIFWLGTKYPSEVFQLYGIMDVVVVPSVFEGFGLCAAEAMAAARPVVASAVDGLIEVIEDGITGYLVPPDDSDAMAKSLADVLSNKTKAQAMGKAGQQRVSQYFSMRRFTESTIAAYHHFS